MNANERIEKVFYEAKKGKYAVSKDEICVAVYGQAYEAVNNIERQIMWKNVKQRMKKLRRETLYHIIPQKIVGEWYYFIPTNQKQIEQYKQILTKTAEGCKKAAKKTEDYVKKKKYTRIKLTKQNGTGNRTHSTNAQRI